MQMHTNRIMSRLENPETDSHIHIYMNSDMVQCNEEEMIWLNKSVIVTFIWKRYLLHRVKLADS